MIFFPGQPRYVHKHEGDGLRVDECEARFLNKVTFIDQNEIE